MILPALLLPAAAALTACGGSSDSPSGTQEAATSLTYSYPIHQQTEVPTPAPVVLHFSDSVEELGVENGIVLRSNGEEVITEARYADKGRSLILTPTEKLHYHSDYVVDFADDFPVNVSDITFSTKAAEEGLRADVISDENMELARILPSGGESDPMMDFSTLRFQFTQPIDRQTVSYGIGSDDTVVLMNENEEPVPAWVVVDGPHLTIDPKEDLTAGHNYRIRFKAGAQRGPLASIYGETFSFIDGSRYAVRPASSLAEGVEPDERPLPLVQYITTPESEVDDEVTEEPGEEGKSPLTGKPVNEIPVNAVLLGDEDTEYMAATQQEGTVLGDLAFLPDWPRVSPLRIRRGTLLTGDNIDVKIGGQVEAGFDSGEVRVHFLSDATGYLIPNIYDENGPRLVRLYMDVAMSTEDPIANGGVTQDITHLELVGTVTTDTNEGVIDINAVGVVEPMILGQERGYGTLSFQLQTDRDQTEELVEDALYEAEDVTPPTPQSWTFSDDEAVEGFNTARVAKPGDPIILNFDEPIERASVKGNVKLYKIVSGESEQEMPANVYVDGTALVIKPQEDLKYSPEEQPVNYRIKIDGVTDLAQNPVPPIDRNFSLATEVDDSLEAMQVAAAGSTDPTTLEVIPYRATRGPIILAAYPGYPCSLEQEFFDVLGSNEIDETRDLEADQMGRCSGGHPGFVGSHQEKVADDVLPVMDMPEDRSIIIGLSKTINPSTVVEGSTFFVERFVQETGEWESIEKGELMVSGKNIFYEPSSPWTNGELYRYRLLSAGYGVCTVDSVRAALTEKIIVSESTAADRCLEEDGVLSMFVEEFDFICGVDAICDDDGMPIQTQPFGTIAVRPINEGGTPTEGAIDYIVQSYSTSTDAGGVDFVQFFRGAPRSHNIVQLLTTQPVSDVNGNFFSERSIIYDDYETGMLGHASNFTFVDEEYGPLGLLQPGDLGYNIEFDPDGLKPAPNSAKLLSRGENEDYRPTGLFYTANGITTGCAFDNGDPNQQLVCPEKKFSYLMSSLVAEVTDVVTDKGIEVKLWPALVAGTSVDIYAATVIGTSTQPVSGNTGVQLLRMRYEGEKADQPITAYIREENNEPILVAEVELYIDVPFSMTLGLHVEGIGNGMNQRSYPATLELSGPIKFLDDGRMVVEQWNTKPFDIFVELYNGSSLNGYGDLFVPAYGSRLNYVSQPIK